MDYRERYDALFRRHLDRAPRRAEGVTAGELEQCEARLGVTLPAALRTYYQIAGRLDALNKAHNLLFTLDELRLAEGYLWFMEENQAVVHWGVRADQLGEDDPVVYQRASTDDLTWYSEEIRFSEFLVRTFDWQAGLGDVPA